MLVPRNVFEVAVATTTDRSRYTLDCVKVTRQGESVRAEATDGRVLLVAQWQEPKITKALRSAGKTRHEI